MKPGLGQWATRMREADNASAAALFERIVIEEREHKRLLLEWMALDVFRQAN